MHRLYLPNITCVHGEHSDNNREHVIDCQPATKADTVLLETFREVEHGRMSKGDYKTVSTVDMHKGLMNARDSLELAQDGPWMYHRPRACKKPSMSWLGRIFSKFW